MEDITDADYARAKEVYKSFKTKHSGEYHDFYIQGNTLLLADVLDNFCNICLEIYEADYLKKFCLLKLVWESKKTRNC